MKLDETQTPLQYFKRLIKPATVRIYHATFGMIVFVLAMTTVALATYRDVQLDLASDIVTILEGGERRMGIFHRVWRDQPRGHPEGATGLEGFPRG